MNARQKAQSLAARDASHAVAMSGRELAEHLAALVEIAPNGDVSRLSPPAVVKAAEPADHPLHSRFEWDDGACGALYRLDQARQLIRSVRVVFQIRDVEVKSVRYVRDATLPPGESGYADVMTIKSTDDVARDTIEAEVARAVGALRRARGVAASLGEPVEKIEAALSALGRV